MNLNKKNLDKKGMEGTFWVIIGAVIALVVLVLVIFWFQEGGKKGFGVVQGQIRELNDCDKDGTADMFDKCDCDPKIGEAYPEGAISCLQAGARECTAEEKANCQKCGALICL